MLRKLQKHSMSINGCEFEFSLREDSKADSGVFRQIFVDKDYSLSRWKQGFCLNKHYQFLLDGGFRPLIVDAGANIGASAAYFMSWYKRSYLYALEPAPENCELFRLNLSSFNNWSLYPGALSSSSQIKRLKLRSDWGHRLTDDGDLPVSCIDVPTILRDLHSIRVAPFVLKIDIEGGESDIIGSDLTWVDSFPLIIIEFHDWAYPFAGTSREFMRAITEFDFDIVVRGENVFFFNRRVLLNYY